MTEKDVYENGVALLEEWEDVNYCEHSFKFKDEWLTDKEVVDLLNELNDENEQLQTKNFAYLQDIEVFKEENTHLKLENEDLKIQLQNTSDQRDEFHRGARENANRVGKLEKENEQLKKDIEYYKTERRALFEYLDKKDDLKLKLKVEK